MGEQRFRLTDQTVKGIRVPPAKSDVVVADSDIPGFAVRVLKSGKRIFQLRYRTDKTTVRKLVLGEFGTEVTTAEARQMAEAARGLIRQGRDPWRERQEAAAATEAAKKRSAFTVEKLIENWRDLHLRPKRSADYAKNSDSLLRAAVAKLLPRPAPSVTKADIVAAIDALASGQARGANGKARGGHIAANRAIAAGSAAWNFAIKRGELPEPNPWNIPKPGDETARERTLSDVELAAVWWAADGLGARWAAIVRLLALTGARLREVAEMEWRELDLDSGDWTLDRTRAKNRLTSIVPLPPAAIEILRALPRADGAQFVFETKGRKGEPAAPSAFSKPKAALDKLLGKQVAPWRFHDLRRTAETGFQRLGVPLEVAETVLNHISGTRGGIAATYARYDYRNEKRDALARWSQHIAAVVGAHKPKEKAAENTSGAGPAKRSRGRPPGAKNKKRVTSGYYYADLLGDIAAYPDLGAKAIAGRLVEAGRLEPKRLEAYAKEIERAREHFKRTGIDPQEAHHTKLLSYFEADGD